MFTKFGVYFRYFYLCFASVTICSACDKGVSQCLFYFLVFFEMFDLEIVFTQIE